MAGFAHDPAEARQMAARFAETAVSVVAKGPARPPQGEVKSGTPPEKGTYLHRFSRAADGGLGYNPVRRLDKGSSTTANLMLKTRRSSRYQPHIDRAKSERKFVLNHACHRAAVDERAPDEISRYFDFTDFKSGENDGRGPQSEALEPEAGETAPFLSDALIVPLKDG